MNEKPPINKVIVVAVVSAAAFIVSAIMVWRLAIINAPVSPSSSLAAPLAAPSAQGGVKVDIKKAESEIAKDPDSPRSEKTYLDLADAYEGSHDLLKSKETYQRYIEKFPTSNNILKAQEAIDGLNVKMLFSRDITPGSVSYVVQKGDNLTKIAKKFNTTVELLKASNGLKDDVIRLGQKLKAPNIKFSISIDKSQKVLALKADGAIFKTYRIATGKDATPTPAGTYKITNKIVDPPWYPPGQKMIPAGDPRNVLGSRWMGISSPSYGIHGTTDPDSIGGNVTEGCVRLKNSDVEELYSIVPEGTEVVIQD